MTFQVGGKQGVSLARRRHLGILGALAASLALSTAIPGQALAQDTAAGGVTVLEGIVVTGEKIDRAYLDTFTSVGVATNEDIRNYQLDELSDTFNQMANVRLFSSDRGNSGFQIRGVNADGVAAATNSQPTISVIIDGATQSVEGLKRGSRGTWDVKQVEVLRGPQSNLYGRAALAGAVVVETNDPSFTPEMEVKGALADDQDLRNGAFMLSGPIVDNQVAFRIAGEYREQFKDIHFVNPADEELGEDIYGNIRGKLLITPEAIPGLSALFTVSHTFDKPAANAVTGPNFFDRVFDSTSSTVEFREADNNNYISNISYGLAEGYTLRSVTALVDTDVKIDSAPGSTTFFRDDVRDGKDFTQDLRLEIQDEAKTGLSGVVGVSYGDFKNDSNTNLFSDFGLPFLVQVQNGVFSNETETQAIYADLRYKFYGPWSLIGGLRYQHDEVRNSADAILFGNLAPSSLVYDVNAEFDVLLPKYGLAYEIDETQTLAFTASKGYRQGFSEARIIFDALPPTNPTSVINEVDPEFVWTYELAYRKTTADKRLTYGVNLFYNEYKDQQVSVVDDNLIYDRTFNVGESVSYGAEFEGRYDFGNGLTMFGAVGLLKTEFKDFNVAGACFDDCNGNEFPESPQLTFSFGGTYKHASGFFGSANVNYTGDYYTKNDVNNLSQLEIDSYFLVNAKVGYEYQGMTFAVFADNLLDEQYLTGFSTRGAFDSTFTPTEASIGDGRIVGVEVRAKF